MGNHGSPMTGYRERVIDEIRTATRELLALPRGHRDPAAARAIACHLLKLCCTSRAWRNVLAAALSRPPCALAADPRGIRRGRRRQCHRPGAGRRRRAASCSRTARSRAARTPRWSSSNIVLTFVDMALALLVFVYRAHSGPAAVARRPPSLPAFDYRWAVEDGVVRPPAVIPFVGVVVAAGRGCCTTSGTASARRSPRDSRSSTPRPATSARSSSGSSPTGRCASRRSGSSSGPSGSRRASSMPFSSRRR